MTTEEAGSQPKWIAWWVKPSGWVFPLAWLVCGALAAALLARYVIRVDEASFVAPRDFAVYLRAVGQVDQGQSPYHAAEYSQFRYAPGVLTVMQLLPWREPFHAWRVFASLAIVCFFSVVLFNFHYRKPAHLLALCLGLALSWKGMTEALSYGQIEPILFGIAGAAAGLLRPAPFVAGLLAGTLPWFKLHWLLLWLPLFLMLGRNRKGGRWPAFFAGLFAASFLWSAALPAWTYGSMRSLAWSQQWLEQLRAQPIELYLSPLNQSVWASLWRWAFGVDANGVSTAEWSALLGGGLIAVGWILGRVCVRTLHWKEESEPSSLVAVSPWFVLLHLVSPMAWRWSSLYAVGIPFCIRWRRPRSRGGWIVFGCLLAVTVVLWAAHANVVARWLGYDAAHAFSSAGVTTGLWLALVLLTL